MTILPRNIKNIPGGLFIVFEGIDGAGTTTQAELAAKWLSKHGYNVLSTAEPTKNSPYSQGIRKFLQGHRGAVRPDDLVVEFTNDRTWHTKCVVMPSLLSGNAVVCDRYWPSTWVYQGDTERLRTLVYDMNKNMPLPDVVFYLRLDADTAMRRIGCRNTSTNTTTAKNRDVFEDQKQLEVFAERYDLFFDQIRSSKHPMRSCVAEWDGRRSVSDIHSDVKDRLETILNKQAKGE